MLGGENLMDDRVGWQGEGQRKKEKEKKNGDKKVAGAKSGVKC